MIEGARAYAAVSRASLLAILAYRLRFYTGIVTYLVYVAVYTFLWKAVYGGGATGGAIAGFTLGDTVTYVAVGWIARSLYFNNVDYEVAEAVLEGRVAVQFLRPLSFLGFHLAQAFGETIFRAALFAPPVALAVALLFPVHGPAGAAAFTLFLASTLLSFLVLAGLNFLVGLLAFWLRSVSGVLRAKGYAIELLSGLLMPIPFFPAWFRTAADFLPFQQIAYTPLSLYLGQSSGSEALGVLAVQAAWAAGLLLAGALLSRRAARALTVHGG